MNAQTPAIEIKNLAYAYGKSDAVHDLSITVPRGKCYGLFGRNGAGNMGAIMLSPKAEQLIWVPHACKRKTGGATRK